MTRSDVSVALCTFNGARFLRAQVESIWAQSLRPAEIVAVDDGSSDGTYEMLLDLAIESPVPMRIERNPINLGYAANFERALSLAQGDIVFLCDQDDVWDPRKIEAMVEPFQDPSVVLVYSDAELVDEALQPLAKTLFGALRLSARELRAVEGIEVFRGLLKRNSVAGAGSAVKRRLVELARPFETGFVHDEWLALIACLAGRVVRLDQTLLLYRQHGLNQIGVPTTHLARLRCLFSAAAIGRRSVVARLQRLHARMLALGVSAGSAELEAVEATLAFALRRSALPEARLFRLPGVARLWLAGDYRRYARGLSTALRDVLEPPHGGARIALGAAA
jgi:hypothetical protein